MPNYQPMERELHTEYRVFFIEKLIINFALPSDLVFHTVRAFKQKDKTQTVLQRIVAMWKGKVVKYQKLLRVKDENGGTIPADYQALCRQTPCGKTRLWLAMRPWRHPKRAKSALIAEQNARAAQPPIHRIAPEEVVDLPEPVSHA
jgi:hypothetical protein